MSERKNNFSEAWWKRKAVYVIVAVIGLVLSGFGFVTQDQVDAFAASPLLATLVGLVAASKTNPGSDSTATAADVARAATDGAASQANPADIAKQVAEYFQPAGKHAVDVATDTVNKAATSVSEYYNDRSS